MVMTVIMALLMSMLMAVVVAMAATSAPSTAAGLILVESWRFTVNKELHRVAHGLGPRGGMHMDAYLGKSRERSCAHATGKQGFDILLLEQMHRCHAAPMLVAAICQNCHIANLVLVDFDQSERLAVAKMCGNGCVEATGGFGGNRDQHVLLLGVCSPQPRPAFTLGGM
ncbi:MAG: hypothetical protein A2289_09825 [Deltaproteobacteria bacterium RIFOXYA12_FULL_58_15]|nr:MAG: hypothetical protein A2289_09825 [Deltaproteobacteria bacterium RIFOXYA12_FULL_58_15]OGR12653.1 MAG: hypothetical protein A2341_12420 [Deltaproteobacteria bacterium RIFOXYB12_FULL_58_9]